MLNVLEIQAVVLLTGKKVVKFCTVYLCKLSEIRLTGEASILIDLCTYLKKGVESQIFIRVSERPKLLKNRTLFVLVPTRII